MAEFMLKLELCTLVVFSNQSSDYGATTVVNIKPVHCLNMAHSKFSLLSNSRRRPV